MVYPAPDREEPRSADAPSQEPRSAEAPPQEPLSAEAPPQEPLSAEAPPQEPLPAEAPPRPPRAGDRVLQLATPCGIVILLGIELYRSLHPPHPDPIGAELSSKIAQLDESVRRLEAEQKALQNESKNIGYLFDHKSNELHKQLLSCEEQLKDSVKDSEIQLITQIQRYHTDVNWLFSTLNKQKAESLAVAATPSKPPPPTPDPTANTLPKVGTGPLRVFGTGTPQAVGAGSLQTRLLR